MTNQDFAKETDGFFARHFDRKISGAISRQLLKTPVTPNQITVGVTLIGIGAGLLFAQPGYGPKVWGSLVFLLTSILDGCDGEIARAKKMTSKLGGWLDLLGDNVVHIAVFYGLGLGLYKDTGNGLYFRLSLWAVFGTFVSAALASYQTYRKSKGGGRGEKGESLFTSVAGDASQVRGVAWKEKLVAISDALARRDFIYGVVALALIGHLEWFLWALAIGVNVYALVLFFLLLVV